MKETEEGSDFGSEGGCTRADNKKCFTFQSTNNMAFNGQAKRAQPGPITMASTVTHTHTHTH